MDYTELIEKLRNDSRLEILDWDSLPIAASAIEALQARMKELDIERDEFYKIATKSFNESNALQARNDALVRLITMDHETKVMLTKQLNTALARVTELTRLNEASVPMDTHISAIAERDAALAKLEALEKQAPVAYQFQTIDGGWHPFLDEKHYQNTVEDGRWPIRALYLAPVPTKTLSEPEPVELTDADCTRIYNAANGITDKNPPISTKFIFAAMRAAAKGGLND